MGWQPADVVGRSPHACGLVGAVPARRPAVRSLAGREPHARLVSGSSAGSPSAWLWTLPCAPRRSRGRRPRRCPPHSTSGTPRFDRALGLPRRRQEPGRDRGDPDAERAPGGWVRRGPRSCRPHGRAVPAGTCGPVIRRPAVRSMGRGGRRVERRMRAWSRDLGRVTVRVAVGRPDHVRLAAGDHGAVPCTAHQAAPAVRSRAGTPPPPRRGGIAPSVRSQGRDRGDPDAERAPAGWVRRGPRSCRPHGRAVPAGTCGPVIRRRR